MEVIATFLEKEIEEKLFDRELFGVHYWEYIRAITSCEVNSYVSQTSAMFAKTKFSLKKYAINLKYLKSYFLNKRKAEILFISQSRRIEHNGVYRNNYIDYYIDETKKRYKVLTLEEPSWSSLTVSDTAHKFPLYTENVYLTDFHELFLLLRIFLFKNFCKRKMKKINKEYDELLHIISGWYKVEGLDFYNYFVNSIIRLYIDRKFIRKTLLKIKPKIMLLHFMPSVFKEMLIAEANKLNIKTIEIQHGTITKVDPLVNKCYDVSKLNTDNKYIFSFGENQICNYALSIKDFNNIKNIGFPFFEEKLKKLPQKKKKYILIISQSTIGEKMAEFASKLADILLKENIDTKIVFKYHPNEISRDFSVLKKDNIIEIKTEKNIYDIQNESILQIGSYSTSLYEGFAMKIPTLVIRTMFGSVETLDIFENINHGVYYIDSEKDVLNYINKKGIIPNDKDIKKLWQFDSIKNINKYIDELMKGE